MLHFPLAPGALVEDVRHGLVADPVPAFAHCVADRHLEGALGAHRNQVGDRQLLGWILDEFAGAAVAIGLAEPIAERAVAALVLVGPPQIVLGVLDPLRDQATLELRDVGQHRHDQLGNPIARHVAAEVPEPPARSCGV
jgi:hypothetical protein